MPQYSAQKALPCRVQVCATPWEIQHKHPPKPHAPVWPCKCLLTQLTALLVCHPSTTTESKGLRAHECLPRRVAVGVQPTAAPRAAALHAKSHASQRRFDAWQMLQAAGSTVQPFAPRPSTLAASDVEACAAARTMHLSTCHALQTTLRHAFNCTRTKPFARKACKVYPSRNRYHAAKRCPRTLLRMHYHAGREYVPPPQGTRATFLNLMPGAPGTPVRPANPTPTLLSGSCSPASSSRRP